MLTKDDLKALARIIKATADAELEKAEGGLPGRTSVGGVIAAGTLYKLADALMEAARTAPAEDGQ